jgi:hypothetical protein
MTDYAWIEQLRLSRLAAYDRLAEVSARMDTRDNPDRDEARHWAYVWHHTYQTVKTAERDLWAAIGTPFWTHS